MDKHAAIIDAIGADWFKGQFGVGDAAIRKARAHGMAASWFHLTERECIERGIPCPRSAFNFKGVGKDAATKETAL